MNHHELRIKECLDNYDNCVAILASMPDKELAKKLDLVHIQMVLAEQKKNTDSMDLLEVWRTQIIDARILKAEKNIPDKPNEMHIAVERIETIVSRTEDRRKLLKDLLFKKTQVVIPEPSPEINLSEKRENKDTQLSMF